jgi:CRP-like cAMP-binding protein
MEAGRNLWTQGEIPSQVVFVRDGLLSMQAQGQSGQEVLSAVRGPRSLVGFEALRSQPARASVDTLVETSICVADAREVRSWAGLDAENGGTMPLASSLLNLALEELERAAKDLDLRSGPAVSRLARFLLASANLIAAGRQAPFSKQHVAHLLGIRPETLSRCFKALQLAGCIDSGRAIRILNNERLKAFASGEEELPAAHEEQPQTPVASQA